MTAPGPETIAEPESRAQSTLDAVEVARFESIAKEWWDERGKFRPLHLIGPPRLAFIRDRMLAHFKRPEEGGLKPLAGLRIIDVGCGGGLISEPLCRLGAAVTGIDPGKTNIEVAKLHAEKQGLAIDYRCAEVEALAAAGEQFDAVVCLEVVEHVPDVAAFLKVCSAVLKPGGIMILSTINRTAKAYALAIVGAEYVLGWLPRGTHTWERFVTPEELGRAMKGAGFGVGPGGDGTGGAGPGASAAGTGSEPVFRGMTYDIFRDRWDLSDDTSVNYLAAAGK